MSIIKIPDILTDLAHVGGTGLPLEQSPGIRKELETCRAWGFPLETEKDRIVLRFDQDQMVPYWIQREAPTIAWPWTRVSGFLRLDSTNRER